MGVQTYLHISNESYTIQQSHSLMLRHINNHIYQGKVHKSLYIKSIKQDMLNNFTDLLLGIKNVHFSRLLPDSHQSELGAPLNGLLNSQRKKLVALFN